jgi:ribosomal protein S12 methylthiotransferase accessory factor
LPKFNSLKEADYVIHTDGVIDITQLPDLSDDNIKVEVENCISALSRINLDVIVVNTMNAILEIPAFYTIIPGTHFRERAAGTSVGMFSAKLVAENQDPVRAISELKEMDNLMPGKYYIKFYLGSCSLRINEPNQSLNYFEKALDLDPKEEDIPSIYLYIGHCFKDMDQYKKAISVLEIAETYDNERTDIYNLMGYCYFKLKENEKSIECFRRLLQLNPASAIDYANIASNYRDMGDKKNAIRYYAFALELDPTIDFARENLKKLEENIKV